MSYCRIPANTWRSDRVRLSRFCNLWWMSGSWHGVSRAANTQKERLLTAGYTAPWRSCVKTQPPEPQSDEALYPTSNLQEVQGTKVLRDTTESRLWESLRTTVPFSVTNKIFDLKDKSVNHTLWTSVDPHSNNFKCKNQSKTICDTDESTGNLDSEWIWDISRKGRYLMLKAQKETD